MSFATHRASDSDCNRHSRRAFLAGIGAAGAAFWPATGRAQAGGSTPAAIDVHHHFFPPRYRADTFELLAKEAGPLAKISLDWTPRGALEKMDRAGVATAINSVSTPGVWLDDGDASRGRARECNDFGAGLIRDFPGRFGAFAAIPLPDTEGSLREIEYAFDTLKLDGVGLLTSYDGKLLGDPAFMPVFDELNRRKTVVFVHPTSTCCANAIAGVGNTIIEFPMDTTRTIASLLFSGALARYPDIRFIFSHGGGMLLPVINRIESAAARMKPADRAVKLPKGPEYELARQYYEIASIGFNPAGIAGLRKLFPNSQFLYGSDEPFNSAQQLTGSLQQLGFSAAELQALRRDNALRLLPRFHA